MQVTYCDRCLMPSSRPRIVFTGTTCNACLYHEGLESTDWAARKKEFEQLVDRMRKHQTYDCVIPFSGGKDSAAIAWRCKHEYGLNPLLVCFGQFIWTGVGRRNLHRIADDGFDIHYVRVNQDVSRKLARRFLLERFHIKQHYDSAVCAVPVRHAIDLGIPLVFFAEHGDSTYGGTVLSEDHRRQRYEDEVLENVTGDDARNWATGGISDKEIYPYIYPEASEVAGAGVEAHYWSYYHRWNVWDNADLMREKVGFEGVEPRTDGSFEGRDSIDDCVDGVDFWGMWIKFILGRSTRIASRLVQMGRLTREEGVALAHKHDGEFPEMYLDEVLDYVSMTRQELMDLADQYRDPFLWELVGGVWKPKYQVS